MSREDETAGGQVRAWYRARARADASAAVAIAKLTQAVVALRASGHSVREVARLLEVPPTRVSRVMTAGATAAASYRPERSDRMLQFLGQDFAQDEYRRAEMHADMPCIEPGAELTPDDAAAKPADTRTSSTTGVPRRGRRRPWWVIEADPDPDSGEPVVLIGSYSTEQAASNAARRMRKQHRRTGADASTTVEVRRAQDITSYRIYDAVLGGAVTRVGPPPSD